LRTNGRAPAGGVRQWHVHEPGFYYDLVAPHVIGLDIWETEYLQVTEGAEVILEWYKGTGLRPYFAALSSAADREEFAAAYLSAIRAAYPARSDGRVLFPFRRLFMIAYR
jgi:trans-aconitate 2-methyltransferase